MSNKELLKILGIKATGTYDSKTRQAVMELQKKLGITADGVYSSKTSDALLKLIK
jgi:peptidoglycan hydrolase-like protein with peptidoglycan-binding domain